MAEKPASAAKARAPWFVAFHRYTGLVLALVVLIISVTGLLLNHTDDLGLGKRPAGGGVISTLYGLDLPTDRETWSAGENWLVRLGNRTYLNSAEIIPALEGAAGLVSLEGLVLAAGSNELLLFMSDGELVERFPSPAGAPLQRVGLTADGLAAIDTGTAVLIADADLLSWTSADNPDVVWAKNGELPAALVDELRRSYVGQSVSAERVLLDIHSGRILGYGGVLLADLFALLLIALAVSGIVMWWKKRALK